MGFIARGSVHGLRDPRDRRSVQHVTVALEPQGDEDSFFSPPGVVTSPTVSGQSADPLGLANQATARERDFSNQYMGSQIAPQWTAALESLRGHRVSMDPAWAQNKGIADDESSSFNTTGPGSPSAVFQPQNPIGSRDPAAAGMTPPQYYDRKYPSLASLRRR